MRCISTCNNCEQDEAEFLTVDVLKDVSIDPIDETTTNAEETSNEKTDSDSSTSSSLKSSTNYEEPSLESCSIVYLAGYLAKKCWDKFVCIDCDLFKNNEYHLNDPSQILILHKTFDNIEFTQGLKIPSDKLLDIVAICLNVFKKLFPIIKCEKKIILQFKENALPKIYRKYPYLQNSTCNNHYIYIIELLFRTKLFKQCKIENLMSRKRDVQSTDKLRVLQNK